MKQQFYIWLILIIGITSCQDVDSLVNSIAKENRLECEAIGFGGSPSSLYKKFEKLKRKASKEELIKLTNHDSLAVVGYSSYALIDKELIEPDRLLKRFINHEDKVWTFCVCQMGGETLSSLIYHRYWNSRIEFPDKDDYENSIINDSENLQRMDSLILYSENPDWILVSRALDNRLYSDKYKSKIEEWAFKKVNFYALKYVFHNLKQGNEERLELGFNDYIKSADNHRAQKEQISQMLKELKNKY